LWICNLSFILPWSFECSVQWIYWIWLDIERLTKKRATVSLIVNSLLNVNSLGYIHFVFGNISKAEVTGEFGKSFLTGIWISIRYLSVDFIKVTGSSQECKWSKLCVNCVECRRDKKRNWCKMVFPYFQLFGTFSKLIYLQDIDI